MDPHRARTAVRLAGLVMLLGFGFALLLMQRSLVAMKAERGQGTPAHRPRPFEAEATVQEAARRLVGGPAVVTSTLDLDGDGAGEALVELPQPQAPPGETWVRRVVVLGRRPEGWHPLFDSAALSVPRAVPPGALWRVHHLTLAHMDLEAVRPSGSPLGLRMEVTWEPAGRLFRTREIGGGRPSPR